MKQDRISQTALKVALGLITLSVKDDWAQRLPPGLVEVTERLLLASGSPGYGPALMRASKKQWMRFSSTLTPGLHTDSLDIQWWRLRLTRRELFQKFTGEGSY